MSDSSEGSRFEGSRYLFATFLRLESTAPMIAEASLSALYLFIFNAERSICRLDQGHPDEAPCLSPRKFFTDLYLRPRPLSFSYLGESGQVRFDIG